MKFLAIVNGKWIYKPNVPSACIGVSVCALHPSEFLSYFQTISCSNSKGFKDNGEGSWGGGDMEENSDHLVKIPSEFISCPH